MYFCGAKGKQVTTKLAQHILLDVGAHIAFTRDSHNCDVKAVRAISSVHNVDGVVMLIHDVAFIKDHVVTGDVKRQTNVTWFVHSPLGTLLNGHVAKFCKKNKTW